jgi:hypothetical protein
MKEYVYISSYYQACLWIENDFYLTPHLCDAISFGMNLEENQFTLVSRPESSRAVHADLEDQVQIAPAYHKTRQWVSPPD